MEHVHYDKAQASERATVEAQDGRYTALNQLEAEIESVGFAVTNLIQRLSAVLRPEIEREGMLAVPQAVASSYLEEKVQHLRAHRILLESLPDRIDL